MSDAPERIWLVAAYIPQHYSHGLASWPNREHAGDGATEYLRADLHAAEVARLTAERDAALDQRDMWMERAMDQMGDNLNAKAAITPATVTVQDAAQVLLDNPRTLADLAIETMRANAAVNRKRPGYLPALRTALRAIAEAKP